jgi:type IV secretory pathway VirB2 component (pilin)
MTKKIAGMSKAWQAFCMFVLGAVVLFPDSAFAWVWSGGSGGIGQSSGVGIGICGLAAAFIGEVAAGVATIAVCAFGAMACLGRVQWTQGLLVAVGISILFGASWVIPWFATSGSYCQ